MKDMIDDGLILGHYPVDSGRLPSLASFVEQELALAAADRHIADGAPYLDKIEHLAVANSRLQDSLDAERAISRALQDILGSAGVATLVLDAQLRIRFFTPASKPLASLIPGDIGRPLTDLSLWAANRTLAEDVRAVLEDAQPVEREIETIDGSRFVRRVLPNGPKGRIEGIAITFTPVVDYARRAPDLRAVSKATTLVVAQEEKSFSPAPRRPSGPLARLTTRQLEIMQRVLAGQASKIIAADLGISQRTVENHRASIMKRTGAKSIPALVRLAISAGEESPQA